MVFRRRPFRRPNPQRRDLGQPKVAPIVRQQLIRAQQAGETGDFETAIRIYSRLAREGYARGHYRPGAQMDIAAVRVLLRAGRPADAASRALHALRVLLEHNEVPRGALPLADRIERVMEDHGMRDDAVTFRQNVDALLNEFNVDVPMERERVQQQSAPQQYRLPAQCTACYAPLDPDDVEWLADDRIRCPYCGRVVLAE